MCGIAGIISKDPSSISEHRLKLMTDSIKHRGPEGDGFWINQNNKVGFGHRRLCIIDLSDNGAQPMHYLDRYTIVYNGEIYNYIELKDYLQKLGYNFYSETDTEIILAAYDHFGTDCLQHFDGMFAFALWDEKNKILFAARDRFGEKPFFFYHDPSTQELVFASEIKALVKSGIKREWNNDMLLNFAALGWTENPVDKKETFYKKIYSLPPAHYLIYQFGTNEDVSIKTFPYWSLNKTVNKRISSEDAIARLIELFDCSLNRRLRSDVPIGTSLSGGLDSCTIAASAEKFNAGQYTHRAFSAVFPGFEKDESYYIDQFCSRNGIDSFKVAPDVNSLVNDFEKFLEYHDQPLHSASVYAQYKVYELARQHNVTVLLDGQGSDETMAGYMKYINWYLQELMKTDPGQFLNEKKALQNNQQPVDWGWRNYLAAMLPSLTAKELKKKVLKNLLAQNINRDFLQSSLNEDSLYKPTVRSLNDILHFNTNYFGLGELLRYADSNSMAHSREVRLPFLNHELVEFAFSLPAHFKIHQGWTKWILRKSMETRLPPEITWRIDKVGFEPPEKAWLTHPKLHDLLIASIGNLVNARILKPDILTKKNQPLDLTATDSGAWRYLVLGNMI